MTPSTTSAIPRHSTTAIFACGPKLWSPSYACRIKDGENLALPDGSIAETTPGCAWHSSKAGNATEATSAEVHGGIDQALWNSKAPASVLVDRVAYKPPPFPYNKSGKDGAPETCWHSMRWCGRTRQVNQDPHSTNSEHHFQSLYLRAEIHAMQFIRQSARPSEKIDTAFQRRLRVAIK